MWLASLYSQKMWDWQMGSAALGRVILLNNNCYDDIVER